MASFHNRPGTLLAGIALFALLLTGGCFSGGGSSNRASTVGLAPSVTEVNPEASSTGAVITTIVLALFDQDMDAASNDPDFPQEWIDALGYSLAVRLAPGYGVPMESRVWLKSEANEMLDDMMGWDDEPESVYFQPDMTGTW